MHVPHLSRGLCCKQILFRVQAHCLDVLCQQLLNPCMIRSFIILFQTQIGNTKKQVVFRFFSLLKPKQKNFDFDI